MTGADYIFVVQIPHLSHREVDGYHVTIAALRLAIPSKLW
jgi:hypothetical protein